LALAGLHHPFSDGDRILTRWAAHFLGGWPVDGDRDVDAIRERTAQLRLIAPHRGRRAVALGMVLAVTARTGVGGRHQQETARKLDRVTGTREHHAPLLERLAKRLERVAGKLAELVQEEHPAMGECDLARS